MSDQPISLFRPHMHAKQFLDSTYFELQLFNPEAMYFDSYWGVRTIADALNRSYMMLSEFINKQDRDAFHRRRSITIQEDASGDIFAALPPDFIAFRRSLVGSRQVVMKAYGRDVSSYQAMGSNLDGRIMCVREGNQLTFFSDGVAAGDTLVLNYIASPPVISTMISEMQVTADPYEATFEFSGVSSWGGVSELLHGRSSLGPNPDQEAALAYLNDEWIGAMGFDLTQSLYGVVSSSSTADVVIRQWRSTSPFINSDNDTLVLVRAPSHKPIVMMAIQAQACLLLKGKDLSGWRDRVAMLKAGSAFHDEIDGDRSSDSIFEQ